VSYVDEKGTAHPTDSDPWDAKTQAHLAFCKVCNPYALPVPLVELKEVTGL
jgi:hypothetical protein